MKLLKFVSFLLIALLSLSLFACGGNDTDNDDDDDGYAGNGGNSGNGGDDFDVSGNDDIIEDLEFDLDGNFDPSLLEGVEINLWSVIGAPDNEKLKELITKFNIKYQGSIKINIREVGHYDYYNALENTHTNDYVNFPDMCLMHNEKNIEYAAKDYFRSVDEMIAKVKIDFNFDNVYDNIERTTVSGGVHYGIPVDAHGYLMQIRQDIIKKNGLGFDGNSRFVPNSYAEYQQLLDGLRAKADSGELWTRSITKGEDHTWYQLKNGNPALPVESQVTPQSFYPAFLHEQESDILTNLYVNGGTLTDADGNVNFHNSTGYVKYVTDFVNRYHAKLYGDADGGKEAAFPVGRIVMFSEGPWQVAGGYDFRWNSKEMATVGNGVTATDANDPIYSKPYTVSRSYWAAQEGAPAELADKWYGNGHVLTLNRKMTSLKKIAGALVFAQWLTQGQDSDGNYNLTDWCTAGHIPAWRNVYESASYQAAKASSLTLTALGDPAKIISLESTKFASILIPGLTDSLGVVHESLLANSSYTVDDAKNDIVLVAESTQSALDLLNFDF